MNITVKMYPIPLYGMSFTESDAARRIPRRLLIFPHSDLPLGGE